ncbi:hypothetical protein [Cecembia sp.]|nr:hypothetical protein [Cecembia sp.]
MKAKPTFEKTLQPALDLSICIPSAYRLGFEKSVKLLEQSDKEKNRSQI